MVIDGIETTFTYNSASPLTQEVWGQVTIAYTYDDFGNEIERVRTGPGQRTVTEIYL